MEQAGKLTPSFINTGEVYKGHVKLMYIQESVLLLCERQRRLNHIPHLRAELHSDEIAL